MSPCRLLTAFALGVVVGRLDAQVLLDDDFEPEHGGTAVCQVGGTFNWNAFAHWTVARGTVDLITDACIRNYGLSPPADSHGLYVDLDGSSQAAGRLVSRTPFALAPGIYALHVRMAGSPADTNTVTIALGSVWQESFTITVGTPWTTVTRAIVVGAATTGALVLDHQGGDNSGILIDEVRLVHVVPGTALAYGTGCSGHAGTPVLAAAGGAAPWLGETLPLQVAHVPTADLFALLALGASNAHWNTAALPMPLAGLGLPGCTLYASPDASLAMPAALGTASLPLALPFLPAFLGTHLYAQALVPDAGSNAVGAVVSNGLDLLLGLR